MFTRLPSPHLPRRCASTAGRMGRGIKGTAIELSRNSETYKGAKYPVSFEFLSFGFNPITFLRFAILNSMTVGIKGEGKV